MIEARITYRRWDCLATPRLTIGTERVTLEDLRSKNGTFVNGKQIATIIDLEDGSEFHVGGVKLVFRRRPFGKSTITLVRSRAGGR